MDILVIIGSVFVVIAAVVHIVIFFLEGILWSKPAVWKVFGLRSQEHAEIVRPMAFNQGFYNAFLAVGAGTGLVMLGSANVTQGGIAVTLFACASMVLAALVLITSSPKLARAAILQGAAPLVAIVFLLLSLASA